MYSSEQESQIERFNEHTSGIWRRWPENREVLASNSIRLEDVYRNLYAKLAPGEPPLPACWSYKMTVVTQRGDGMLETKETLMMPSADMECTYELLIAGVTYVTTSVSDYDHKDSPWVFIVRAPTTAALERAVAELTQLLPPQSEIKMPIIKNREETFAPGKTGEPDFVHSDLKLPAPFMSMVNCDLSALKEHLEKLAGITNLKYDFLYNLAECEYEYEDLHFDLKSHRFSVCGDDESDGYKWDFYVAGGECPDEIISELIEYCKLFEKK